MTERALNAELLSGTQLYQRVVLERLAHARESVVIATANVKAMLVELQSGQFKPVVTLFARRRVAGSQLASCSGGLGA